MASKRRLRRNACKGKLWYRTQAAAGYACRDHKRKHGVNMQPYQCKFCGKWHIGHSGTPWGMDKLFNGEKDG